MPGTYIRESLVINNSYNPYIKSSVYLHMLIKDHAIVIYNIGVITSIEDKHNLTYFAIV